jgi:hypothetical protein
MMRNVLLRTAVTAFAVFTATATVHAQTLDHTLTGRGKKKRMLPLSSFSLLSR